MEKEGGKGMSLDMILKRAVLERNPDELRMLYVEILLDQGKKRIAKGNCIEEKAHHFYIFGQRNKPVVEGICSHCEGVRYLVNVGVWGRGDQISIRYLEALVEARQKNLEIGIEDPDVFEGFEAHEVFC